MFDIHRVIRLLDGYAREGCRQCELAGECYRKGKLKERPNCRHAQALLEVEEFHRNVQNGFKVVEAKFVTEVTKLATDGVTQLAFDAGDVFILKGEFSQNQFICKEKGPGGKEFTVTKKTEGTVWEKIL